MLRIVLMYGVMALIMIWNGYFQYRGGGYGDTDPAWRFLLPLLMWGLWTFGCLSASFTMEKMKTKTSRLSMFLPSGYADGEEYRRSSPQLPQNEKPSRS